MNSSLGLTKLLKELIKK